LGLLILFPYLYLSVTMIESGEIRNLSSLYFRNNRSTGQKSLRCFPSCGIRGHTAQGFCGAPIQARLQINIESFGSELFDKSHQFLAEIRPLSEKGLSSLSIVSSDDIQSRLRKKTTKNTGDSSYYLGNIKKVTVTSPGFAEVELDFNSSLCSYDYPWKSNRWKKAQETHVVDIVLAQVVEGDIMKICSSYSSGGFVIKCSKKPSDSTIESHEIEDAGKSSGNPQQVTSIPEPTVRKAIKTTFQAAFSEKFFYPTVSKYRYDQERFSNEAMLLQSLCSDNPGTDLLSIPPSFVGYNNNSSTSNFFLTNRNYPLKEHSTGNELIFLPRN